MLRARGRLEEATPLYRSLAPPHTWFGSYTARASFELGVITEQQGKLPEAAQRYGASLALWDLGGSEVASWRRRAREALERIVGEIG